MADIERSGSLAIQSFSPESWEAFTRDRRGEVRITDEHPIPCPSPWHHPIRWLRWNPLLRKRITMVLPSCEVVPSDDGSVQLRPHPLPEDPAAPVGDWRFGD